MNSPLVLPSELTIYTVAETRLNWLSWLTAQDSAAQEDTVSVDAAAVQEVDTAGVQLLLALQRSLAARQQTLSLLGSSTALVSACQGLGVHALLGTAAPTEATS